jgi:hypothetical protein
MNLSPRKKILLSCCSYPGSVAYHLERALRKRYDVRTWGPSADGEVLERMCLRPLERQASGTDIPYDTTDPADALAYHAPGWVPDAFLWIESGVQFGINLSRIHCPKACYLINTHVNLPEDLRVGSHLKWARHFDVIFLAQRQYLTRFQRSGLNTHWLPVACDPEVYMDHRTQRIHPLSLIGKLNPPKRQTQLELLGDRHPVRFEWHFMNDAAFFYSAARVVWNDLNDKLSRRLFEAMACGAAVLADPAAGSGVEELFSDGNHLCLYRSEEELLNQADHLLANDPLRERVAIAGQQEVLRHHTYENRVSSIEQALFPKLS